MLSERAARALLASTAILAALTIVLAGYAWRLRSGEIRLEELGPKQRLALLEQAERVSPAVFRPFLFSGEPGFYHLQPNRIHENLYGATFVTNDLGFRTVPTDPAPDDRLRLVVVGDSWTFSPFVRPEAAFPAQLERLLNRAGPRWQVYNLGMMGYSTANEVAALRTLFPRLDPDAVVICPTPNDADESFTIWDGRMVTSGFTSRAIFRDSYLTERRWIEAFHELELASEALGRLEVPVLLYFIGNWRGMQDYYADRSGLDAPAVVLPRDYVDARYRLPATVDPGEHATEEGNGLIATYLHNALIVAGIAEGLEPLPLDHAVELVDRDYDAAQVEEEFRWAREEIYPVHGPDMIPVDRDYMLRRGIYTVPVDARSRSVDVALRLIDSADLYPLEVELRLEAPEEVRGTRRFEHYAPGVHTVTLGKPQSLDGYDFVDVVIEADGAVVLRDRVIPVSLFHPTITAR